LRELYNRETGGRLDLYVFEEPEAVAAKRWAERRRAYLEQLIADPHLSDYARAVYQRELARLAK
jgi:hypothetical protein